MTEKKVEQLLKFYHENFQGESFGGELIDKKKFSSFELGELKKVYRYGKYAVPDVEVEVYEKGVLVQINVTGELYLFRNRNNAFLFAKMRAQRYRILERGLR